MSQRENMKILLLEDSAMDAELVQRYLQKHYGPCTFLLTMTRADFEEALDIFHPDVILADNSLPQFDAASALRFVRDKNYPAAFIMVTGSVSEEFAAAIIKEGADDYILKDRLVRLPAAIDAAVKKHRQEAEKRRALEQLVESEEQYRSLVSRITDAFISLDNNWCYTFLNRQAGELIQKDPVWLIGKNVWEVFPDTIGSATYNAFHQAMNEQRYISNIDYYEPLDLWQENHIYPSPNGISVFIRNITEKKRLERELQRKEREAQMALIAATVEGQEKERNAIAIELHDNVNQILAGTNVLLSIIRDNPMRAPELAGTCLENIRTAVEENRKIAHELVTPDLETISLQLQIERLCQHMFGASGIQYVIKSDMPELERIPKNQSLALYRIMQEQCTNILKYSKATAVYIEFTRKDDQLLLVIQDNGKGADLNGIKQGIGLRNMRARLSVFGGSLQVHTAKDEGFRLEMQLPLTTQ